jgi:hypothetical protein
MAQAVWIKKNQYRAYPAERVEELKSFLPRLKQAAGAEGCVLIGFDFPIGLPLAYAQATGVDSFLDLLPQLGTGQWQEFFDVAALPEQISLQRPFYPVRPGSARREHLVQGLGLNDFRSLRRTCEEGHTLRRAACPLFWTLGGQQVGKAALNGWQQVLIPGLNDDTLDLHIWPFHGPVSGLLQPGRVVVVETYPGEFYHHLDLSFPRRGGERGGKRSQASRASNASNLLAWAARSGVWLEPGLEVSIQEGFGSDPAGEDAFDSVVGLFGMLNVILGFRRLFEPQEPGLRQIEGWIFGQ